MGRRGGEGWGAPPGAPAPLWWDGGGRRSRWPGVAGSHGEEGSRGLRVGLGSQALGRAPGPGMRGWLERMGSRVGAGPTALSRLESALRSRGLGGGFCGGASGPPRVAAQSRQWRHLVAPARPARVSAAGFLPLPEPSGGRLPSSH